MKRTTYVNFQAASGDFPAVLYDVVSKRSSVIEGSLTVDDLNEILDQLSKSMGKQYVMIRSLSSPPTLACREIQSKVLQRVYNRSTPEEQRWIVRLILKGKAECKKRSCTT